MIYNYDHIICPRAKSYWLVFTSKARKELNSFTSNYLFLVKKKKKKNTPFVLFSDKGEVQQRTG